MSTLTRSWVNYTGCDSLYSTAADASTVYFGGHERWASNPLQCDNNTSGTAVVAPGMVGLSPLNGSVTVNPTRGKGRGADDMVVTGAGLWIASDNGFNTADCGRTAPVAPSHGHAGICFLPYATSWRRRTASSQCPAGWRPTWGHGWCARSRGGCGTGPSRSLPTGTRGPACG